jgi:NAD(P) transhydrogenase subunit alpha
MVAAMRPGSVVVDMAAESGGNVEGSVPGEDVSVPVAGGAGEVTVVGTARPGGTFGAFADTHLVWPQAPPRPPRPDDPAFGE